MVASSLIIPLSGMALHVQSVGRRVGFPFLWMNTVFLFTPFIYMYESNPSKRKKQNKLLEYQKFGV